MIKKIALIALLACLLTGLDGWLYAQKKYVYRNWGKVIGKAQTDRDFLIYDATCVNNKLFIVGKAENGTDFDLKPGENTYFHAKDDYTDAFLACMSLDGEMLWSTYLPTLERGYYNAFATTVEFTYTQDNTIAVIGNTYEIQGDLENTQSLIPKCPGKIFIFEFDTIGQLIRSKTFSFRWFLGEQTDTLSIPYPPRIIKSKRFRNTNYEIGGFVLSNYTEQASGHLLQHFHYSIGFNTDFSWQSDIIEYVVPRTDPTINTVCSAAYPLTISSRNYISQRYNGQFWMYNDYSNTPQKSTKEIVFFPLHSRGINLLTVSCFSEGWHFDYGVADGITGKPTYSYLDALTTTYYHGTYTFFGTIQNIIHSNQGKYIAQGIHCRNYANGFFKNDDGQHYAYSHDTISPGLLPEANGFYQKRHNTYTAVPYLLIYDSSTISSQELKNCQTPLWGSYLNVDWYYEDIFHVTDSAHWKDIYQPYEPILCFYKYKLFLIGNAKSIDHPLIDSSSTADKEMHHQGVILSFNIGCPSDGKNAFQAVPFLCSDDSVELKLTSEYAGFTFRFDSAYLANGSIVLNHSKSRAWVKKEGAFAATLDGSSLGCPDVTVDTVRISLSPYPEPASALNPDTTIASCAAADVVLQAVTDPDSTFSYRWFDGDSVNIKTVRFAYDSLFFASVEVNGYCTSFRDSTKIRFLPPYVNLGKDSALCPNHYQSFADSAVLLRLNARQNYFPDADWIFRWQINGKDVSDKDSLVLRYADLEEVRTDVKHAIITVTVSLPNASADACTANDTLIFSLIYLTEPDRIIPQDTILCAHQDLNLQLPLAADDYRCFWLDQDSVLLPYGHDTNRFTITGMRGTDDFGANTDTRNPRFFQLRLDHKLCGISFFDTLLVYDQVRPNLELPFHDTVICLNEPVELDSLNPLVYRPFYSFEWNDGKKDSERSFSDSGTYVLHFFVLKDFAICGYDTASDTVRVRWSDPALTLINIPSDTSFCEKLSVVLDASVPFPATRYSWQEGYLDDLFSPLEDSSLFTDPVVKVDKEVSLALFVVDTMGCVNTRQIEVFEEDCKPSLSVPNVFTPNGDGVNDVLRFRQIDQCYDVDVLIVDRKGSRVLHQKLRNPEDFSWNGCLNNGSRKLPDGAYFYFISYKNAYGKKKYQSGSITILGSTE